MDNDPNTLGYEPVTVMDTNDASEGVSMDTATLLTMPALATKSVAASIPASSLEPTVEATSTP